MRASWCGTADIATLLLTIDGRTEVVLADVDIDFGETALMRASNQSGHVEIVKLLA